MRAITSVSILALLLTLRPAGVDAKTRATQPGRTVVFSRGRLSADQVRKLEQRLRPFLENKLRSLQGAKPRALGEAQRPHETDFMVLARAWNRLSPEFKALYRQATQIPPTFQKAISPGGHFEVYYTTTGSNRVDSTDTYSYGSGTNWRVRSNGPNSVPDYVDEVAWALDSAWSMEIDKFGFAVPIPFKDFSHPSERYKVMVSSQMPSFYGMTYVDDRQPTKGFASYIEINNDWSGSEWSDLGYDKRPENGARVTCAHEFFHAIQYAMTWNVVQEVYLDDFPITWIEGTAVLMEELAFDSINDYLQYAESFFDDPGMSLLDDSYDGITEYVNSVLTKFLFERATGAPHIDFVKKLFDNNYGKSTPFHDNLRATASSLGTSWVRILNDFHTASYFAGSRADTVLFIRDARLFDAWTYEVDTLGYSNTLYSTVNPYGMEVFTIRPEVSHGDTIEVVFSGKTDAGDTVAQRWAASCILRRSLAPDSVVRMQIDSQGTGSVRIAQWKSSAELLLVATSGYDQTYHAASVYYQVCPISYPAGANVVLSAVSADSVSVARASLAALSPLRCELLLSTRTNDSIAAPAHLSGITRVSSLFDLSFPLSWDDSAAVEFRLGVVWKQQELDRSSSYDSVDVYRWDQLVYSWLPESSTIAESGDTLFWTTTPSKPGTFGLFARRQTPGGSGSTLVTVFPNPARLGSRQYPHFQGPDIVEIRLYGSDGALVCDAATGSTPLPVPIEHYSRGGYTWRLVNNAGKRVTPGLYVAVVGFKDPMTKGMKTVKKNVMVYP